jgi:Uncharacterized protein conserved in bacteria
MKKIFSLFFIVLFISGCTKKTENEYMNIAAESWKSNNIPEAIKAYESVVNDYPNGKFAPKALMELGRLYQYKIDKSISERDALDKAIDNYKKLIQNYPKSEEAPIALFMIAFIQSNELKQYDEAKKNYELFLQKYPAHEMSQNAKDELENIGLTPEQILQKKIGGNN